MRRSSPLRWSIGTRLVVAFLVLAIVPLSVTACVGLTQSKSEVTRIAKENLVELSRGTAQSIGQLLTENQRTSLTLAGEALAVKFLSASEGVI